MQNTTNVNLDYTQDDNRNINCLTSGLPQWVITAAFLIMVVAAICTITAIDGWLKSMPLQSLRSLIQWGW